MQMGLERPVILAAGTPQILLPWDNAKVFQRNLEAKREGQYASWTVWTVPNTMSVTAAAQRVGMDVGDLRQMKYRLDQAQKKASGQQH